MNRKLENLKSELTSQGVSTPESFSVDGPLDLPEAYWGDVAGGFGQVFFQQSFRETYDPSTGFRETVFSESIYPEIPPS